MAGNLTNQVRGIAKVVTAVANGDLKRKLTVEAKGEIAELADTINSMIDTLATFADQVTTVAREVGVEGKLGGQANVPGAAGTWRDLTDNVNQLAANLTTQVRAIAEVATAVTKGDLTRSIQVEAQGEVACAEGQHQRDDPQPEGHDAQERRAGLAEDQPREVHPHAAGPEGSAHGRHADSVGTGAGGVRAAGRVLHHGRARSRRSRCSKLLASYAYRERKNVDNDFKLGEGLVGQCRAGEGAHPAHQRAGRLHPDHLRPRRSAAAEHHRAAGRVRRPGEGGHGAGVASNASARRTRRSSISSPNRIGIVLNTIEANMRTEDLLKQSQSLAANCRAGRKNCRQTNQELEEKAKLLAEQNVEVERKNREVEQARQALEEKAEAARAHFQVQDPNSWRTCRTSCARRSTACSSWPISSSTNPEGNLTPKQVEFARDDPRRRATTCSR